MGSVIDLEAQQVAPLRVDGVGRLGMILPLPHRCPFGKIY
jgi:hypothetical protein